MRQQAGLEGQRQWHREGHDERRQRDKRQSLRQMGGGGMRRGDATISQTRWRQCNGQPDKRPKRGGMGGNGAM
jgi:hypothetical protein